MIVANLQPLEFISGGFLLQKGLKMKKIFVAIVACMICNVGWGIEFICELEQCDKGTWALDYDNFSNPDCMVCPANTYQDGCVYIGEECTPCPAGTRTIGDTAADHDSIDDCIPMEIEEKYLVIQDITYRQTVSSVHSVHATFIVRVGNIQNHP